MDRDKFTGSANRICNSLYHNLDSLACFGQKKHEAKEREKEAYRKEHGNLKGWNPSATKGIYSINTMTMYRAQMCPFARFCAERGARRISMLTPQMGEEYLRSLHASGKSAWTLSTAASAINKAMGWSLSPKALGLPGRRKKNIKKCRKGETFTPKEYKLYHDQIVFAMATGVRRNSIYRKKFPNKMVRPNRCVRNKLGIVVGVWVEEKGGKIRLAPVLNEYREAVTAIVNRAIAEHGEDMPLFSSYGGHVRNHRLRAGYAAALLHQLESERAAGIPLFGGEFPLSDYCWLRGKDKKRRDKTQGHDTDLLAAVSGALGHNRVEVILRHYLYLY